MTEVLEGRVARARRERLLAQFVDRSAEMELFAKVLDSSDLPIMVVSADAGMGKTSLMMRMARALARAAQGRVGGRAWTSSTTCR